MRLFEFTRPDGTFGQDVDYDKLANGLVSQENFLVLRSLVAGGKDSDKRLVEGFEAPTRPSVGVGDRTSAVRMIEDGDNSRIELRIPDGTMRAYDVFPKLIKMMENILRN